VGVHNPIHGTIKCLARLDAPVEDPSPARLLFDIAVGRVPIPVNMPPEKRLMEGS
jgi:hypothetical protein